MTYRRQSRDKRRDPRRDTHERYTLTPHRALQCVENERWKCATCNTPALDNSQYCLACKLYWEDVRDGKIFGENQL